MKPYHCWFLHFLWPSRAKECFIQTRAAICAQKPDARADYSTAILLLQLCAALALSVPVHVGQDFPLKKSSGFNSVRVASDRFIVPFGNLRWL